MGQDAGFPPILVCYPGTRGRVAQLSRAIPNAVALSIAEICNSTEVYPFNATPMA